MKRLALISLLILTACGESYIKADQFNQMQKDYIDCRHASVVEMEVHKCMIEKGYMVVK